MNKIISFSLWGTLKKYTYGAIKNAELAKEIYPGWLARFYCGTSVPPDIIDQLIATDAEVIMMKEPGDWSGMFWRFSAIADPEVEVMLSRDTDSRLTLREKAAVDEWLASDKLFHIMRDHPWHNAQILGGMWGARKPILQDINYLMAAYKKGDFWQVDQNFLREVVIPRIAYSFHVNDEFFEKAPFPTRRAGLEFVGQVFDENEETVEEHLDALKGALC